jgi:hypothetical protein
MVVRPPLFVKKVQEHLTDCFDGNKMLVRLLVSSLNAFENFQHESEDVSGFRFIGSFTKHQPHVSVDLIEEKLHGV